MLSRAISLSLRRRCAPFLLHRNKVLSSIREKSEEFKQAGAFFKALAIQALAIETAEATAEWLHRRIREDWGFPDAPTVTMHDRFTSKYHGKRYSFGYPAVFPSWTSPTVNSPFPGAQAKRSKTQPPLQHIGLHSSQNDIS
jgi:hypothetical protein